MVTGYVTNFMVVGSLNFDDVMFGFDIYVFVKNFDWDLICVVDFDSEVVNLMYFGGNEIWISFVGGY